MIFYEHNIISYAFYFDVAKALNVRYTYSLSYHCMEMFLEVNLKGFTTRICVIMVLQR